MSQLSSLVTLQHSKHINTAELVLTAYIFFANLISVKIPPHAVHIWKLSIGKEKN